MVLQLLDLLEQHVENGDVSVQHAALSALRNLAIPGTGLVDHPLFINNLYPCRDGPTPRVDLLKS